MTTESLVLLLIVLFFAAALPVWPHSKSWGYRPIGVLAVILIVFIAWSVFEERPLFRRQGQNVSSTVDEAGQDLKAAGRDVAESLRDLVE